MHFINCNIKRSKTFLKRKQMCDLRSCFAAVFFRHPLTPHPLCRKFYKYYENYSHSGFSFCVFPQFGPSRWEDQVSCPARLFIFILFLATAIMSPVTSINVLFVIPDPGRRGAIVRQFHASCVFYFKNKYCKTSAVRSEEKEKLPVWKHFRAALLKSAKRACGLLDLARV